MAEAPISRDAEYGPRPTVRIDDNENERVSALINAFKVTEGEGGLSSLELRLANFSGSQTGSQPAPSLALEDERDIKLGSKITLYSGDQMTPREIFRGVITGLEVEFANPGPLEVLVLAEDPLQIARQARRTKVHQDITLAKLAANVAGTLSLTPVVTGLTDTVGTHVQLNESDLAFLRRLLDRYDADVQVVGRELHVSPRKDVQRGTVDLALNGQLFHARFNVDLAEQVTEVTTSGWDPTQGKRVAGSSQGTNLGPGAGRTGASLLRSSLAARSEHVSHPTVLTDDEASALADVAFDRRARRFVCVQGTAEGNPRVRVGTHVAVSGASPRFDNTYYVVKACHRYERGHGYETDFEGECAYLGNP